MTKQKTREQLERKNECLIILCMIGWISFIVSFGLISVYIFGTQGHSVDLKQQLSECQEQVPVCDFKEGYWGFKVVCTDDFFGWKNRGKVIDQHFHKDLESCEQGLKFYISYKNCEVVE